MCSDWVLHYAPKTHRACIHVYYSYSTCLHGTLRVHDYRTHPHFPRQGKVSRSIVSSAPAAKTQRLRGYAPGQPIQHSGSSRHSSILVRESMVAHSWSPDLNEAVAYREAQPHSVGDSALVTSLSDVRLILFHRAWPEDGLQAR